MKGEPSGGMNHSDAVVPDAREAGTNGLPYIPFSHTGMPAGYALLGGKAMEQSGRRYFPFLGRRPVKCFTNLSVFCNIP